MESRAPDVTQRNNTAVRRNIVLHAHGSPWREVTRRHDIVPLIVFELFFSQNFPNPDRIRFGATG
jgi:hypothetical protein